MEDDKSKEHGCVIECNEKNVVSGLGYRHQQCFILFLCLTSSYSNRSCMGVALVAMTKTPTVHQQFNISDRILTLNETNARRFNNSFGAANETFQGSENGILQFLMLKKPYPTFDWSKKTQDAIMSSFFWGYMILQIPAGMLAHRYGARYLLFGSMVVNCIIFISVPWASNYGGWILLLITRMMQGLSQACIFPAIHTLLGKWAPLQERGRMSGVVNGGHALGSVFGVFMTGVIASSSLGWPGIFRFYGLVCGVCAVLSWLFLADTPAEHSKISAAERTYIERDLGNPQAHPPVPWRKVLTNRGVWAMMASHAGQTWGQLTLFSEVPAYMDKIMGVNIKANGVLTALPFLFMWVCNFFFCFIADVMINKKIFSVTTTRKIFNSLGSVVAGLGLIALCYVPKNIYIIEVVLIIVCSFKISTLMGFAVINIDIAPNFAGTIMSLSNFVANAVGSSAPVAAGFILTDVTSEALWRQVFFVAAGFYLISNLIFVILGTAEKAAWNDITPVEHVTENPDETKPMVGK